MGQTSKKGGVADRVRGLVAPVADEMGLVLWDVEYVKEGADMYLRITVDKDGGLTIDDCEAFHRAVEPLIDEDDPIEGAYCLECTSPGIERTLTRDEHFAAMKGTEVEVRLFAPLDGKKAYTGVLESGDSRKVVISAPDGELSFDRSAVAKVTTVFHW
ncbi:MAG: ribosome maturation factor RimP [Clostridia bacterium]|nr:ribosome maturation factor RimP [Clostridia bacterium]